MMQTPIADFVREYAKKKGCRFHMPGHKGRAFLGCEEFDITEIAGADALYEAGGIIAESERNASELFGTARTLFSAEGSSQCIRAMMYLVVSYARAYQGEKSEDISRAEGCDAVQKLDTECICQPYNNYGGQKIRPYVIAARNVHKAFLYAAALVDFDVVWLYSEEMHSLCSCLISAEQAETELKKQIAEHHGMAPAAVYVTSPDYLGGQLDVAALAEVCHRYGTLLAVDNAHGAYLHFLEKAQHPMDLGADICCDSAHKTLPVLTGGAYLQISKTAPKYFVKNAKQAMVLFGSTSPSYLILASLDLCNAYLAEHYRGRLAETIIKLDELRAELRRIGWAVEKTDPLKLTIQVPDGMNGNELAEMLRNAQIECEYADEEYLVLMVTPENGEEDFRKLVCVMRGVFKKYLLVLQENAKKDFKIEKNLMQPVRCRRQLTVREAIFSEQEMVHAQDSLGRICGIPTVGCPPAIPIVVPGEEINEAAVKIFVHYGVEKVAVVQ